MQKDVMVHFKTLEELTSTYNNVMISKNFIQQEESFDIMEEFRSKVKALIIETEKQLRELK